MDAVNYSNFQAHMKQYFKRVNDNREPLIVSNEDPEDDWVILSKDEYDTLTETLRIEANKYLMAKIERGQKQAAAKKTKEQQLIDPE